MLTQRRRSRVSASGQHRGDERDIAGPAMMMVWVVWALWLAAGSSLSPFTACHRGASACCPLCTAHSCSAAFPLWRSSVPVDLVAVAAKGAGRQATCRSHWY